MENLNRGDKIYLDDKAKTKESTINNYLSCRDGIVDKNCSTIAVYHEYPSSTKLMEALSEWIKQ